ncbi:beta-glucuronidase [Synchytrium endobioticum]|uniref:Beta-glucuronidase n=1 Tax=Synchytrium endobioticum TaxID=286115 RepID=A0A507DF43_9FUNG|nr:beta-glucuronidase [Synchytrium endobioticum]
MQSLFTPTAQQIVFQLFSNLQSLSTKPLLIRVGGISEDEVWLVDSKFERNEKVFKFLIDAPLLEGMTSLASQLSIEYLIGLPTMHSMRNVKATVEFAQALVDHGVINHTTGVELGNEPRNSRISAADYARDYWIVMLEALYSSIPELQNLTFAGLSSYTPDEDIESHLDTITKGLSSFQNNQVKTMLTAHTYGTYGHVSIQELLNTPTPQEFDYMHKVGKYGETHDVILGETNSVIGVGGGVTAASNVFGSALWALDFYAYAAWKGLGSARLHGVMALENFTNIENDFHYSPFLINQDAETAAKRPVNIRPLYYAMIAFTRALSFVSAAHDIIPIMPTNKTAPVTFIKVYGFSTAKGAKASFLIINKSNVLDMVSFNLPPNVHGEAVHIERLTAPSVSSTNGIAYAGQTFDGSVNGMPSGMRVFEQVQVGPDGMYEIAVEAYSACVVLAGEGMEVCDAS